MQTLTLNSTCWGMRTPGLGPPGYRGDMNGCNRGKNNINYWLTSQHIIRCEEEEKKKTKGTKNIRHIT